MLIQTEYEFELPHGYADDSGTLHRRGTAYLTIIILARVITKLGTIPQVDTKIVEKLFTADLAYLQDLYQRINQSEAPVYNTICPKCGQEVELSVNFFLQNE